MATFFQRFNALDGALKAEIAKSLLNPHFVEFIKQELPAIDKMETSILLPETNTPEANQRYMTSVRNLRMEKEAVNDLLNTINAAFTLLNPDRGA